MYGGAAVLVRETARRIGGGWPAMVLLAAAFGVGLAGLVDQSLFNDSFLADTEFAGQAAAARATMVPGLDISAQNAFAFIGNHVVLSICAPIAIVESYVRPGRRHAPWLGRRGLVVAGLLYLLGSWLIFTDDGGRKGFMASPLQLTVAVALLLGLVGAALLPRWRRRRPSSGRVPHPVWVGLLVLTARSLVDPVPGWLGLGLGVAANLAAAALVVAGSRRAGWGQRHVLAAWAGGLVLAAAYAYLVPNYAPASPVEALVGDVTISVVTLALLAGAFWRLREEQFGSGGDGSCTP